MPFQMIYPGPEAYVFPSTPKHESPCMTSYWKPPQVKEVKKREDYDKDEYTEVEDT